MDVKVFESRELIPVLRALSGVARANEQLTPAEADFIEGVARLHGQRVSARELRPISMAELGSVLTDPQRRQRPEGQIPPSPHRSTATST